MKRNKKMPSMPHTNLITNMFYLHKWFLKESPSYMTGYSKWYYMKKLPVAYVKFMWLSIIDWKLNVRAIRKYKYKSQKYFLLKSFSNTFKNKTLN